MKYVLYKQGKAYQKTGTSIIVRQVCTDNPEQWVEVDESELPQIEEPQGYTAEQLEAMTNAELSAILADMGISGSMTKANMIALILDKQNSVT